MFGNSSTPYALTVATSLNKQLTITEATTWNKLQKLSQAA